MSRSNFSPPAEFYTLRPVHKLVHNYLICNYFYKLVNFTI